MTYVWQVLEAIIGKTIDSISFPIDNSIGELFLGRKTDVKV
jgi:hypothetical protein